jgi:hypothetical protein
MGMVFFNPEPRGWARTLSQLTIMVILFVFLQKFLGLFVRADHTYGNLRWYFDVGAAMHEKGFFNVWTPYPPVFPGLLYLLSAFQKDVVGFINLWKILSLAGVAGITYLTFRLLDPESKHRAILAAAGFALINATWASRVTIGLYMDQFDYLPISLLLLALLLLVKKQYLLSAVFCGIGAMTKMFPGVVLLIALFSLEGRKRLAYAAVFVVVCCAIILPYVPGGLGPLVSWYNFTASRDAWETVWNYPKVKFPPIPNPDLLVQPFRSEARPYAWLAWLSVLSMLTYMVWQQKGRPHGHASLPQQALCLVLLLLIFSKGVSSYFVFWLFPLIFICYRPLLAFVICTAFIVVANIEFFVDTHWLSIWGRHALFLALLASQIAKQAGLPQSPGTSRAGC